MGERERGWDEMGCVGMRYFSIRVRVRYCRMCWDGMCYVGMR